MLSRRHLGLVRRLTSASTHFNDVELKAAKSTEEQIRRWRTLEGILSYAWQAWCGFSRVVLIESCLGTQTRSGTLVPPQHPIITPGRIAYVAKCLSKNEEIRPNRVLSPHQEPMWGDRQLVLECARHFQVANINSLEIGLLLDTRAAKDMRTVRNATAHLSKSGLNEVQALGAYYTGTKLRHPTDFLSWIENDSGEKAFSVWIADLIDCAELMTE